jgi:pyridine nucleotide-disulfide oxidoreductase
MEIKAETGVVTETCDLCIIGAGIAGLNALFVATQYLQKTARVVLIDRNSRCGGMWTQTYDYVRLHQPHQMFTVGDLPWLWDRPPEYLATGTEVLWHLQSCLDRVRPLVDLSEHYRTICHDIEEIETNAGPCARIHCEGADGARYVIQASRAIHAAGWDIPAIRPLPLSSGQVVSTCPDRLGTDDSNPAAPALVIGGGKTGMDSALELMARGSGRQITLLNGHGAVFGNRDILFPTGIRRWWQGAMVGGLSADVVGRFDGRNATAAFGHFRRTYAVSPDGRGEEYMFSTLSGAEARQLGDGLSEIRPGYLADVVDSPNGPEALLRDGARFSVAPGSLVVNCTGHLMVRARPAATVMSPLGTTLSITPRASVYFLSTSAAYFLTHSFYLNLLGNMPLYALDMESLKGRDPKLFFLTCLTHSFLNMMTIMDHVPLRVFSRCGLDINRWYPLPRRLLSFARLKLNQRRNMAHCRSVLDYLREVEGVACAPRSHR